MLGQRLLNPVRDYGQTTPKLPSTAVTSSKVTKPSPLASPKQVGGGSTVTPAGSERVAGQGDHVTIRSYAPESVAIASVTVSIGVLIPRMRPSGAMGVRFFRHTYVGTTPVGGVCTSTMRSKMPPGTAFTSSGPEMNRAVLLGQLMHAALPGFEADPQAHALHEVLPDAEAKVPAAHAVQGGLPVALKVPGAHWTVQLHAPTCDDEPEGHVWHPAEPTSENVPVGHKMHDAAPPVENWPHGQAMQDEAPENGL